MNALLILILLTVLAVSVAINFFLMRKKLKTSETRACSVLLQGIKNVSDLMTIRQNFQSIVIYEDARKLLGMQIPGTFKKFILKYTGNIVVGTDLSEAEITQYVSGNVVITVPRSRILDVVIDMNSIRVYDQRAGIFTSLAFEEQNHAIAENLNEVGADADAGEVKKLADENAKNILESLSRGMGIMATVEFFDENDENEKIREERVLPQEFPQEAELKFV